MSKQVFYNEIVNSSGLSSVSTEFTGENRMFSILYIRNTQFFCLEIEITLISG